MLGGGCGPELVGERARPGVVESGDQARAEAALGGGEVEVLAHVPGCEPDVAFPAPTERGLLGEVGVGLIDVSADQ